jgi:hypothetical protein
VGFGKAGDACVCQYGILYRAWGRRGVVKRGGVGSAQPNARVGG